MTNQNRVEVPPAVEVDGDAVEILTVWIGGDRQHFTLRFGAWEDPAAWGLLLAD